MEYNEFEELFMHLANEYNIKISGDINKYYKYMNSIIEKNQFINLTSIIEPKEFIIKHFIDSLVVSSYLEGNRIIDIGTGAGFPGVPLAINSSDKSFVLVDSVNKKLDVIRGTIKELNINNIEVIHSRAEELANNGEYREKFDIAVSRAVANLTTLVEYMLPFVKVGGTCICMKGPNYENEVDEARKAISILGGEIEKVLNIDIEGNERNIIFIRKNNSTPTKYPRGQGKPLKEPIK